MSRHSFRTSAIAAGLMWLGSTAATPAPAPVVGGLYPNIVDTSHASWQVAHFFQGYFTAKSIHNPDLWLQFFHPTQVGYYDATLGEGWPTRSAAAEVFTELMATWPKNATSYPLQIFGDTTSAVVHSVDTPGLFGAEIRQLSAVDFRDGKVTRQVDYWDGRRNPAIQGRSTNDQYPTDLGLDTVEERAASEMIRVARQLNAAFSSCDAEAAAAMFSYDAVFEDNTLRTREDGQLAIGRYLQRALGHLPYGPGTTLRHILGSARGGGYEWQAARQPERNGITALELDGSGLITRLVTIWDGSRTSDSAIQALTALSIEP